MEVTSVSLDAFTDEESRFCQERSFPISGLQTSQWTSAAERSRILAVFILFICTNSRVSW